MSAESDLRTSQHSTRMSSTTAPAEPASPAPATVSLPAVFSNSVGESRTSSCTAFADAQLSSSQFWSHDYREGFERVYSQLEASVNASNEVLQAVQQRATAERAFAHALAPPALRQDGFAQGRLAVGADQNGKSSLVSLRRRGC